MNIIVLNDIDLLKTLQNYVLDNNEIMNINFIYKQTCNDVMNCYKEFDLMLICMNQNQASLDNQLISLVTKKKIPIIFVLENNLTLKQLNINHLNNIDYIYKPLDLNILIHRITLYQTILEQKQQLVVKNKKLKEIVKEDKERIKQQELLIIQESKNAILSELIGAISHQWRQPLNIIASSLLNLEVKSELNTLTTKEIKRINLKVNKTLIKLSATIDDFRNLFLTSLKKEKIDLNRVISSSIDFVHEQFSSHNIHIISDYNTQKEYFVWGYFNELKQVLLNLLINSKESLDKKRESVLEFTPTIMITITNDNENYIIKLSDNGNGINELDSYKVFSPYYTTKGNSLGKGIGLYMSKIIITKLHNGKIYFNTNQDDICFSIKIRKFDN